MKTLSLVARLALRAAAKAHNVPKWLRESVIEMGTGGDGRLVSGLR
jgi:hypothetical protein